MAGRRQDLETRIVAKDDASKTIDKVADKLDTLEGKDATIDLKVDDKASDDIRELDRRLDGLSDEDKTIVLRAQAKDAQRDVDRLVRSLAQVDRLDDEEVKIRVDALGDAKRELKAIEDQAERLDNEKVDITVDVDDQATGRFGRLRTELGQTSGVFNKLGVAGKSAFSALSTYGPEAAAATGVAITAFVTKAVSDFQNLALEIGKTHDALGIPAEEASRLREVSEDMGISFGTVEKALGRMNLAAANTPAAFENIGAAIVRSDDGAIDVTATFLETVDAINAIPDAAARAAAGQKIFGKGWVQIAPLIASGADDVRAAMDAVGEGKIVSDEQIRNARDLRESIDGLRDRMEEFSNNIGSSVTPALAQLADGLGLVADAAGKAFAIIQGDFDIPVLDKVTRYAGLTGLFNAQADAVKGLRKEFDDLRGVTEGTVGAMAQIGDGLTDTERDAAQAQAVIDRLGAVTADLYESSTEGAEGLALLGEAQDQAREKAEAHITALEEQAALAAAMADGMRDLADVNRELAAAQRDQAKLAKDETATTEDRVDVASRIADLQVEQFEAMKQAAGATATATEKLDAQNKALLAQAQTMKGPARAALLDYLADLNGIPEDKVTRIEALLDEGKIEEAQRLINRLSENREATVIWDVDTSAADAERDRLDDPIYTDMIVTPKLGEIIRRANGGPVPRDSFVRVGERGPETLALPGGSYVYPHGVTPTGTPTNGDHKVTVVNVNQTFNTAVMGDPHAVMNAVDDANRRIARLLPLVP